MSVITNSGVSPESRERVVAVVDPYVKWVLGIVAVLVAAGGISMVTLSISNGKDLAVMDTKVDYIVAAAKRNHTDLEQAKAVVRALEIVTARISDNHTDLKDELTEIRRRLVELEKHNQQ